MRRQLTIRHFAGEIYMPPQIDPFHAISVARLALALEAKGASIIHMEFGQPSTGAPKAAIAAAHKMLDRDPGTYWESPTLRDRIAQHYLDKYGVMVGSEQIILTCGASPALVLALVSTFSADDRIAVARPGYVAYRNTLKALHMVPIEIDCGAESRFQLTAEHLRRLDPAPAGVIIASPANPTGTIIDAAELQAIVAVCEERGIQIISDEIYHGLSYGERAHSILEYAPQATVINSFSKYFSMVGWRLGWLLAPLEHVHRARAFSGNLFLTAPSLSQHAALAAMDAHDELERNVLVYRTNRDLLIDALPALGLTSIAPPDGAFYIYADVSHLTDDSLSFCKEVLKETGVAIAPGIDFDPINGSRFVRMSFAISTPLLQDALGRLAPVFRSPRLQNGQCTTLR